jgi:hypothetical protein
LEQIGDQEGPAKHSLERLFLCQMSEQSTLLCAVPLDLIFRLKRLKRIMKANSKEDGLEIVQKALSQSELLELSEDGMRIQKKNTAGVECLWDSLAMLLTVLARFDHAVRPTALCSHALACALPTPREMRAIEISAELSLPPSGL